MKGAFQHLPHPQPQTSWVFVRWAKFSPSVELIHEVTKCVPPAGTTARFCGQLLLVGLIAATANGTYVRYVFPDSVATGCIRRGGAWTRPYGDASNNIEGVYKCRDMCANGGSAYFGLECPGSHGVHCQCSNKADDGTILEIADCQGRTGSWSQFDRVRFSGNHV